jgi:hypothetical protein
MDMCIHKRAWVLKRVVVFAFALGWALPAHALSCNAVHWDEQSLTLHWDDLTIAGCLLEAQKLQTEMDKDPVEGAFHAVDDVCAQLETNHLAGDILTSAEKVCAKLRAGIKREPAN